MMLPLKVAAMTVEQEQRFLYYFYEAERLWQAEQYMDAYTLFDFCHTLNPKDAITCQYIGHIYRGCKLPSQAIAFYQIAWEQAPKECWRDYAVALYNTGEKSYQTEAIRVMEQTSQLVQDADLWEHLRDAYIGIKQYDKALHAQDQMDKIVGYDAYSAINRYRIYLKMNKPKLAIAAIEKYLEEDATNLQFQLYRMELYEATGQPTKQLVSIYQQILQLDPYNTLVLNNYAYLLATHKGDLRLAEKMSLKAVQAEPTNYTYLDTYAWILHLTGQEELAKLYMRQAISQCGEDTIPDEIQQHYHIIFSK